MGWLVGYVIASAVGALFVVRFLEYLFSGVANGLHNTAQAGIKAGLFVATWTAITGSKGMGDLTRAVRKLRKVNRAVSNRIDSSPR